MKLNRHLTLAMVVFTAFAITSTRLDAQGLFGGGGGLLGGGGGFGGGGFGGGGGFRGGGGLLGGGGGFGGGPIARPAPSFGGGGGLLGGGRPSIGGGAPLLRPAPAIDRPILGGGGPSAGGLPAGDRPLLGGGGGPIISPPSANSLPGGDRPILGDGPSARPLPGGDRPILGDRPGIGDGPSVGRLPNIGMPSPAPIPAIDLPGNVRPSQPVTAGGLDDFLNSRPSAGTNDIPQIDPGELDGGGPIASQLPDVDRPGIGEGPGLGDRPIIGDGPPIWDRPIVGERPIFLPDFGEAILRDEIRTEIIARRVERAASVRDRIHHLYYRANHPFCYWWHYMWTKHPIWSWWRITAPLRWCNWNQCTSYYGWSGSYAQPVQYEYTDQGVYADGREVKTNAQYTEQALQLAREGAEKLQKAVDEKRADKLEWLPLGVFSLNDKQDGDPAMFLQLAISKEAIVAGTYFNAQTSEYVAVQGGLDKETQRVAVTVGDKEDVVIETGMYSLTEEQSSALLHFEGGKIQNWILVRMADPQGKQDGA